MKPRTFLLSAAALTLILILANLAWGSVKIPLDAVIDICLGQEVEKESWSFIVVESRLPQALTALLAGASLAIAGLLLQTAFNKPAGRPFDFGSQLRRRTGRSRRHVAARRQYQRQRVHALGHTGNAGRRHGRCHRRTGGDYCLCLDGKKATSCCSSSVSWWDTSPHRPYRCSTSSRQPKGYSPTPSGGWAISRASLPDRCRFLPLRHWPASSVPCCSSSRSMPCCSVNAMPPTSCVNVRLTRVGLLLCTGWLTAVVTAYCGPISFIGLAVAAHRPTAAAIVGPPLGRAGYHAHRQHRGAAVQPALRLAGRPRHYPP